MLIDRYINERIILLIKHERSILNGELLRCGSVVG